MKLILTIMTCLLLSVNSVMAQWMARASFPGVSRAKATAFTIGSKIYVLGGVTNSSAILDDFWEYDITLNTWTQKPNFPGPERYGAVSFVIGNKGYVATGGNDFGNLDDMWEYNPSTGLWLQKTGMPAGSAQHENQRTEAFSFVIGNKAYIGGGTGWVFMPNSTVSIAFFDLWEYDPVFDSWTSKSDIPDFTGRNMSIGVAVNNKGYVGLGCNVDQNINHHSFWEYDPLTDNWTSKSDFPTNFTTDAGAFELNSELYVVGGVNLAPVSLSGQFYKYEPATDQWTALTNFNGGAIAGEFAVSTGTSAFIGGGYNSNINTRNDLWEFTSGTTGINDYHTKESVSVYPIPATDYINIRGNLDIDFVEIFDISGRFIFKEVFFSGSVNIDHLESGAYKLKLTMQDGSIAFKSFIKAN